MTEISSIVSTT